MFTYQKDEFGPFVKINMDSGSALSSEEALVVALAAIGEQLREVNSRLKQPLKMSTVSISGPAR
jgi:hypothetical protein